MNKKNLPCYIDMGVILFGIILEIIGGILSRTTAIGFNFNLSPVLYLGVGMIVAGFIVHFPLKFGNKKNKIEPMILDIEAIIMILAIIFAVIYLVCCITFPVLFPTNG